MAPTVLITGFGPFPGAQFNPTTALPHRLAARRRPALADVKRIAHVFRTSYAAVDRDLPALLARVRPDAVLLFGVATRTNYLRIETRARNARSPLFPDVDGNRPRAGVIAVVEPSVRAGSAPHRILLGAARAQRLPVRLSHSAGRYLCNFAYWRALALAHDPEKWEPVFGKRSCAGKNSRVPLVQFVHVPTVRRVPMRPRADRRRLTPADLLRAGEAILLALVAAARVRQREGRLTLGQAVAVPAQAEPAPKRERRQAVAG